MEIQEVKNLKRMDGNPPPNFGRTLLIRPSSGDTPNRLLANVVEVWTSVAQWGTWRQEELGEWPTDEDCLAGLPDWFRHQIEHDPTLNTSAWLGDLHDREWIWWGSNVLNGLVKIDLDAESLPISVWMLEAVVRSAGGQVAYQDRWITTDRALELGNRSDS